jgi:hypothetical protein
MKYMCYLDLESHARRRRKEMAPQPFEMSRNATKNGADLCACSAAKESLQDDERDSGAATSSSDLRSALIAYNQATTAAANMRQAAKR